MDGWMDGMDAMNGWNCWSMDIKWIVVINISFLLAVLDDLHLLLVTLVKVSSLRVDLLLQQVARLLVDLVDEVDQVLPDEVGNEIKKTKI